MIIDFPRQKHIPMLRDLWKEAFGDSDEFLNAFFQTAFSKRRSRCVIANEQIAAALYWFDCRYLDRRVAYIYAVATKKAWQGKGLCKQLMADTHALLREKGYVGVVLVPREASLFDFYRKIGYQTTCYTQKIHCVAANQAMSLRKIEKEEYAALRSFMLPIGGVIQPDENIDFLETQFDFYAGEDLLLAARADHGVLRCTELLGDASKFSMAIRSLDCERGEARSVGQNAPFAMCFSFDEALPPPTYFGLAFD